MTVLKALQFDYKFTTADYFSTQFKRPCQQELLLIRHEISFGFACYAWNATVTIPSLR